MAVIPTIKEDYGRLEIQLISRAIIHMCDFLDLILSIANAQINKRGL